MYLAEIKITNFRRLKSVAIKFQSGLNIITGPNNIGKTAIVDALRALLAGDDEPYPRFNVDDVHRTSQISKGDTVKFEYIFRDLSLDDEADFIAALVPNAQGKLEAKFGLSFEASDATGRLKPRRWCGSHDDIPFGSGMLDNLRSVYLPPLRDASRGLRPSSTSQLARLIKILSDEEGRKGISDALIKLDGELKKHSPLKSTQAAISTRHSEMLGHQLSQTLDIGLSVTDFEKLSSRLSLLVDSFEIERNGLGYNNLIFMAVVLSELAKNADAAFRSLIVEEPEAHLHPQLQAILLKYLSDIQYKEGEKPVQVFVTSHSPNFASLASLDTIVCLTEEQSAVHVFHPRETEFESGKKEKLERYLDVTRAELFFARRIIFVEGAAELNLLNVLATEAGYDLRKNGVSLISVDGLNFDCFLPLFGEQGLRIPVAVITDADPVGEDNESEEDSPIYPDLKDTITPSANTKKTKKFEDALIKVFHGVKTLEYDLALEPCNRQIMLSALNEIHPRIASNLKKAVDVESDNKEKAKVLFQGMFERPHNNVQKGRYAQALASEIAKQPGKFKVPNYIVEAMEHAGK